MKNKAFSVFTACLFATTMLSCSIVGASGAVLGTDDTENDKKALSLIQGDSADKGFTLSCDKDFSVGANAIEKDYTVNDTVTAHLSADGTLTVSGSGEIYYEDYTAPWYNDRYYIKSLKVNEGITAISSSAFYECFYLETAALPSTLTLIGTGAFADCYNLTEVSGIDNVTEFGSYAFQSTSIPSFDFPPATQKIYNYVFYDAKVAEISLPASVTEIGALGYYAKELEKISVSPENPYFTSENGVLFSKDKTKLFCYPCAKQGSYTIPSEVTVLAPYAFGGASVEKVVINSKITNLPDGVFAGSDITELIIPDNITYIGYYICEGCTKLASVNIGNGVESLGYRTFYGCSSLTDVVFGENIKDLNRLTFAYCTSLKRFEIPYGVDGVSNGVLAECTSLETVIFPETVTYIAYQAFLNDTALKSVDLPQSLEKIYRYSFYGSGIQSVEIPKGVSYIGEFAFPDNTEIIVSNPQLKKNENGIYMITASVVIAGNEQYKYAFEVLELMNEERAKAGAAPLEMDSSLLESAMTRAYETSVSFSHTRPNGTDCFSINSRMASENIAVGNPTPAGVVNSWMNSPGHKANMLDKNVKSVGIGAVKVNGIYYWVQCFGTDDADKVTVDERSDVSSTRTVELVIDSDSEFSVINENETVNITPQSDVTLRLYFNNTFVYVPIMSENIEFTSSDTSVCTVSSDGRLSVKAGGVCTVTMKFRNYDGFSAVTTVIAEGVKGDVNGDGKADISDATSIQCYLAGIESTCNTTAADLDGSGDISINDVTYLQRMLADADNT